MCAGDIAEEHNRLQRALQLLLMLLPAENRSLLSDVLQLLHLAASHESTNKMSADNLATLFTPHLLCPRKVGHLSFSDMPISCKYILCNPSFNQTKY